MAALSDEVKRFVVQALACFDTPSQVSESVKEEFGLALPRQQCELYDPTRRAGRGLSRKWRALFEETRAAWQSSAAMVPIANRVHRLRVLDRLVNKLESKKNYTAAAQILEQAAKEMGGMYERRGRASGGADESGDGPAPTPVVRGVSGGPAEERRLLWPDEAVPDSPIL